MGAMRPAREAQARQAIPATNRPCQTLDQRSKWNRPGLQPPRNSADQSGTDIIDHVFPNPCTMLMKEFGTRIPKRSATTAWPPPIAIRMQHDPRLVAERPCQMHHHGVDADDNVQLPHAVAELYDVWRADVPGANAVSLAWAGPHLQRVHLDARFVEFLQQPRRDHATFVPVPDFPDQSQCERLLPFNIAGY